MLTVKPFPYQDVAINRALDRGNLLIAYGMGLGKSLIQMGISETLLGDGEISLNALVVPASLKWQWAQNLVWGTDVEPIEKRLQGQKIIVPARHHCVVIDGNPTQRDKQYRFIRDYRPNYVILGYDNVVNDWRQVKRINPDLICLDEATAIKSFTAERSIMVKQWDAPFRYALTGTPIDNRADELFSIMEWVDPAELGRPDLFDRTFVSRDGYGRVKRYKNLDVLHKKTKNFVARKTRFDPDVAPFMPKDFHKDFTVKMSGQAKTLYNEIAEELVEMLSSIIGIGNFDVNAFYGGYSADQGSAEQGQAMAMFGALTMLCDHPALLLESAQRFRKSIERIDGPQSGSKYAWQLLEDGRLDWIVKAKYATPKFTEVNAQIADILEESSLSKVILFSFSKTVLRLFKDVLGDTAVIFDGDMNSAQKEEAKMRFKRDPDVRVFLSSDAGGMGVDLPEANYLINFNHPWSAGKADQRNSRHIRAGSNWAEVFVLNYVVINSIEEWKYGVLNLKRKVGSAIIDGVGSDSKGNVTFDTAGLLEYVSNHRVG